MTLEAARARADRTWASLQESARPLVYVGAGSCGLAAGAAEVLDAIRSYLAAASAGGESAADVLKVGCIGPCYLEPLVDVQMPGRPRVSYSNVTPDVARQLLAAFFEKGEVFRPHLVGHFGENGLPGVPRFFDHPMLRHQVRIVLRNCGIIDPENVDHYLARDGYRALEKCVAMPWREDLKLSLIHI